MKSPTALVLSRLITSNQHTGTCFALKSAPLPWQRSYRTYSTYTYMNTQTRTDTHTCRHTRTQELQKQRNAATYPCVVRTLRVRGAACPASSTPLRHCCCCCCCCSVFRCSYCLHLNNPDYASFDQKQSTFGKRTLQSLPTVLRNLSEDTSRLTCAPQDCMSVSVRSRPLRTTWGLPDLKHLRMRLITSYTLKGKKSGGQKT